MGADMHYMVEYRRNDSPTWWAEKEGSQEGPRDSMLFANLAGVRNRWGIVPVAQPRGLPSDRTHVTWQAWQAWVPEGHSASWISDEEYAKRILGLNDSFDAKLSEQITEAMARLQTTSLKYRIVFWFDN